METSGNGLLFTVGSKALGGTRSRNIMWNPFSSFLGALSRKFLSAVPGIWVKF